MSSIPTLVVLAMLAQAPAAAGRGDRFKVTLQYYGVWGLVTEAGGTCPGGVPGTDTLTGVVTKRDVSEDGIVYVGDLTRTTDLGLCEARDTPDGSRWCAGEIHGSGTFEVTVTVPATGRDNENASFELRPKGTINVAVGGNCDSLDNADLADEYRSGDTIHFETANDAQGRVPPTGGLVARSRPYSQTVRLQPDRGYTLTVEPR